MLQEKFTNRTVDSSPGRIVLNRSMEEMLQIRLSIENGGLCYDRVRTMYK